MNWLLETLAEPSMIQAVAVISIVAAVGVYLGRLKIFGISLGITFVFFAGIMAGHLGITVNKDMLNFAQNFGLIVFVYTLGLQVGPGFFSSLKKGGVEMNTMGLGVIALGLILTLVFHWITGISVPVMVGLLSGAVTNTPALGAAQQALLQMDPENTRNVTDMALACAVAYPLGVVGVILAIIILRSLFAKKTQDTHKEQDTTTNVAEFQVLNPSIYNKSIQQVMKLTEKHFVISRLWRNGKVTIPTSETILKEKDHLLIISVKADVESIKVLFGEQETTDWNKEDIDWNAIDSQLISRRIVVTRNRVNGVKLGSLRLRNLYGINITRVNRAGIDLVASRDLRLQIGDKLTIVGEANSVNNVGKILGDELKRLDKPQPACHIRRTYAGRINRGDPNCHTGNEYPHQAGYRRRTDHRWNLDGCVRPPFPPNDLYHPEREPDDAAVWYSDLSGGTGNRLRSSFLRDRLPCRRIVMDRPRFPIDDRTGLDRRVHRLAILQARLRPQHRYAMRKHGQSDGLELCQYDRRG